MVTSSVHNVSRVTASAKPEGSSNDSNEANSEKEEGTETIQGLRAEAQDGENNSVADQVSVLLPLGVYHVLCPC